jgi:hypothetical protein
VQDAFSLIENPPERIRKLVAQVAAAQAAVHETTMAVLDCRAEQDKLYYAKFRYVHGLREDGTGKPKYPSEKLRDAIIARELDDDEAYRIARTALRNAEDAKANARQEFDRLERLFRINLIEYEAHSLGHRSDPRAV